MARSVRPRSDRSPDPNQHSPAAGRPAHPTAEPCPALPDHVIEDIFARLPGKSVMRCRCLSRAWAATLASDDFVDLHLRLANRQGGPRILLLPDWRSRAGRQPVVQAWSPDHPAAITTIMEVPRALTRDRCPFPVPAFSSTGIAAPYRAPTNIAPRLLTQQCRGLVVLEAAVAGTCHVFNPSTGQTAALPEGRRTARGAADAKGSHSYASFALGYDASTKKHKVVRIFYRGCDADKRPWLAGCEVYVINSGTGLWRPAEGGEQAIPPGWVKSYGERSVFAQGHVHWLAKPRLNSWDKEKFMASFSLHDEKFRMVPLPPSAVDGKNAYYELKPYYTTDDLGGRVSLFCSESCYPPPWYDMWLLREDEMGTWDQQRRIDLSPKTTTFMQPGGGFSALGVVDNGRRIVLIPPCLLSYGISDLRICAFSTVTGQLEDLTSLAQDSMVLRQAALYEESVVSPGQPHQDIIFPMSLVLLRQETAHKTLARLKCVCRSWRTMIESEDFRITRRS